MPKHAARLRAPGRRAGAAYLLHQHVDANRVECVSAVGCGDAQAVQRAGKRFFSNGKCGPAARGKRSRPVQTRNYR